MFNEGSEKRGYRAYLVRLWPACGDGQTVWRASIEDAHTGERRAFTDLAQLFAFLEEPTQSNPTIVKNREQLQ
jgi:hypothetical protein